MEEGRLVRVGPSRIDGLGVFAVVPLEAGRRIGKLYGEIISQREGRRRARGRRRICIVELENEIAIDASIGGNEFRYVNHSCSPNSRMRIWGKSVVFYALTSVQRGEELTCDYGATHHDGRKKCRCGSEICRGRI